MINTLCIKVSPQRFQRPFVSLMRTVSKSVSGILVHLSLCAVLVAHVGGGVLVDAVVGEVGEHIPNFGALVAVFVGREPGDCLIVWRFQSQLPDKAIIVEVDSERVDTGHQHVEAQIKFRI